LVLKERQTYNPIYDTKNDQTKKTSLSALYVLTKDDEYKKAMTTVMAEVNANYKLQKKTPKQEENWLSQDEIKSVYDKLHENAIKTLKKMLSSMIASSFSTYSSHAYRGY
jgi:hypothetical protein